MPYDSIRSMSHISSMSHLLIFFTQFIVLAEGFHNKIMQTSGVNFSVFPDSSGGWKSTRKTLTRSVPRKPYCLARGDCLAAASHGLLSAAEHAWHLSVCPNFL